MHSLRLVSFIVTLLVCAGCTKSPSGAESEPVTRSSPPAEQPQKPDPRPVIVAFGDSISEGLGVQTGLSFPDQLQRKLDAEGFSYRVVNIGVSGDTTTGGLGGWITRSR